MLNQIRANGVCFLESLRAENEFGFKFSSANRANLIGSSLAVMLGKLLGWLDNLGPDKRKAWPGYLNSFQRKDGFFEDEDISDKNRVSGYTKERALFHRSRHALFALNALGCKPKYRFGFLNELLNYKAIKKWMEQLNLSDLWDAGNKIMDLAIFLSHEAKVNANTEAAKAINFLLDSCDSNIDPKTGYHDAGKSELRNAMAGAMHLYPIYFFWGRMPKYPDKIIKTTLSLQQADGFFAYESGTCGEDCLDYDAASILVNFYFASDFYRVQIKQALERLLDAIESCRNSDGGFCCNRRQEKYRFGTFTTEVFAGGSSLWSTYSRILTIALATKVVKEHPAAGDWNLDNNIMEIWDGGTCREKVKI